MPESKIADEALAALVEAERSDPAAHGYSNEDLLELAELLQVAGRFVELDSQRTLALEEVRRRARKITNDPALSNEEAIRWALALAFRLMPGGRLTLPEAHP